ncbi:hypothetical protein [Bacillus tuaregi]|uniref:hypothetical protein n=1 Tax=Bacillus tuaregi TaxID=1816695 RepID=UPI0008F81169|nr:hypothetical protein [Bacillus tuaregi]
MLDKLIDVIQNGISKFGKMLWAFPLRLMIGWFWIDEAGAKLWGESKWGTKDLTSGLGNDSWLVDESVKMPFSWLQSETTGASAAAGGAEAVPTIPPILESMPGWFEGIMKVMMPTPEVAIFMQKMVVFLELFIGVAILIGLFTWLFSFVSVGMLAMFTLCAMLGMDKFMALPASIALMSGAGRFFGLDYYVMPALGRLLDNWQRKRHGSSHTHRTKVS